MRSITENGNPNLTKQKSLLLIHSLILPDVKFITLFIFMKPFFSKQITELWGMDKDRENWRRWIVVRKNRTAMGSEFLSRVHIALIGKDSQGCIGECLTWICADSIHLSIYSGIDFFPSVNVASSTWATFTVLHWKECTSYVQLRLIGIFIVMGLSLTAVCQARNVLWK